MSRGKVAAVLFPGKGAPVVQTAQRQLRAFTVRAVKVFLQEDRPTGAAAAGRFDGRQIVPLCRGLRIPFVLV